MGYETRVTGEIIVQPSLNARELSELEVKMPTERYYELDRWLFVTTQYDRDYPADVAVRVSTAEFLNDDNDLVVRHTGVAIVATYTDAYKAYHLEEHLQKLIDRINALPTPHTFVGHLDCEGEENTDVWRLNVINGKAVKHEPTITWPVESE